ncbi:hypothetical protein N180_06420 [Pedobacter antarcticus 4BY]|uniref:Uncharacterized protein n=2 Tax=Pedobacter antarcticus TaxID=34086 RepID=A0A081PHI7_9SPHI|nr:hypothetical protein [Pedobacter antarcticus]KEQ30160.1 hypothetical protein N180_06420 [Pedobacter antarcticus 4BY]
MKKLKMNLFMVAALAIAAITMSFKMADTTTQWRYIGTASQPFNDASLWEQGAGSGCGPAGAKPCQLNVDAADEQELIDYFSTVSSTDVYNMSTKKN